MRHTIIALSLGLACATCSSGEAGFFTRDDAGDAGDGSSADVRDAAEPETGGCEPGGDQDQDGIADEVEGCGADAVDTDNDGLADYMDGDSDDDGIPDRIEGTADTDGDGRADYRDTDSDDDGVDDADEDRNGDGLLGCCLETCGEERAGCRPDEDTGCGAGQTCGAGNSCTPPAAFLCADGESERTSAQSFDGKPDGLLPTFICRDADETSDKGLKPIDFHVSQPGAWQIALEKGATYGPISFAGAKPFDVAAAFELNDPDQAVAGFVISMEPPAGGDIAALTTKVVGDIAIGLPSAVSVTELSSGSPKTSHDGFPSVVSTTLAVQMSIDTSPPAIRNELYKLIVGKETTGNLPPPWGPSTTMHQVRLQTLLRADGRLIVMGGVAATSMIDDPAMQTGFIIDDISNGTGLATTDDGEAVECDPFELENHPVADIIWVVDDSQSMDDDRQNVVDNAADFFARALKSGLDFRMGVAGVRDPDEPGVVPGKFCSRISSDDEDDGGDDRFLLPQEQDIFKSCIKNPPYYEFSDEHVLTHAYEAVARHLPRTVNDPTKIRPDATLVVILASDEASQELKEGGIVGVQHTGDGALFAGSCPLDSPTQQKLDAYLEPWVTLYTGSDPQWGEQGNATVHLVGGLCSSNCPGNLFAPGPEIGHGYLELVQATGGVGADICQKDLGATLQVIIDLITGASSPAVLQYVPISASLAVAVEAQQLQRSRVKGFDYIAASNSLVFINVKMPEGTQVVASYRRWVKQETIK